VVGSATAVRAKQNSDEMKAGPPNHASAEKKERWRVRGEKGRKVLCDRRAVVYVLCNFGRVMEKKEVMWTVPAVLVVFCVSEPRRLLAALALSVAIEWTEQNLGTPVSQLFRHSASLFLCFCLRRVSVLLLCLECASLVLTPAMRIDLA
jgi:hypothetical protein